MVSVNDSSLQAGWLVLRVGGSVALLHTCQMTRADSRYNFVTMTVP